MEQKQTPETIAKQIEILKNYVGKEVEVLYLWVGRTHTDMGTLERVNGVTNINITGMSIPFVGIGSAIIEIKNMGKTIYKNPHVSGHFYDLTNDKEIDEVVLKTFGREEHDKRIRQREEYKRAYQERKAEEDRQAQRHRAKFTIEGLALIKPELSSEWKEFVSNNTQDGYSACIVESAIRVMKALTAGQTPEEAKKARIRDITGHMDSCATMTVAYFHPRGEEYRKAWQP